MGKLRKRFEDVMSAAAFAEAGEFDTAREIARGERRVLVATREADKGGTAFKYALGIARRIGAGLDILAVGPGKALGAAIEEFRAELAREGVDFTLTRVSGCLRKEVIEYTKRKKGILFVVTESEQALEDGCAGGAVPPEGWDGLACPLVVVGDR